MAAREAPDAGRRRMTEASTRGACSPTLAGFPERLDSRRAVRRRPDRHRDGEWTPEQVVRHLIAVETGVHQARLRDLATVAEPRWDWTEPGPWSDEPELGLDGVLARFAAHRATTLATIDALDEAGWARTGEHTTFGTLDVAGLLRNAVDHDEEHLRGLRPRTIASAYELDRRIGRVALCRQAWGKPSPSSWRDPDGVRPQRAPLPPRTPDRRRRRRGRHGGLCRDALDRRSGARPTIVDRDGRTRRALTTSLTDDCCEAPSPSRRAPPTPIGPAWSARPATRRIATTEFTRLHGRLRLVPDAPDPDFGVRTGVWGDSDDVGSYGSGVDRRDRRRRLLRRGRPSAMPGGHRRPGLRRHWARDIDVALAVFGKVQFSRSGRNTIGAGKSSLKINLAGVTSCQPDLCRPALEPSGSLCSRGRPDDRLVHGLSEHDGDLRDVRRLVRDQLRWRTSDLADRSRVSGRRSSEDRRTAGLTAQGRLKRCARRVAGIDLGWGSSRAAQVSDVGPAPSPRLAPRAATLSSTRT